MQRAESDADGQTFRYVVQRNGQYEHDDPVHLFIGSDRDVFCTAASIRDGFVGQPHKYGASKKTCSGYQICRGAMPGLRTFNCRLQQRPEAGGNHNAGSKTKHQIQQSGMRGFEKNDSGSA